MKTDDFHATFTLRQHTPIIHFQADQPGALLRVSELKPAFDQYLWQNVFKIGTQPEKRKAVFESKKTYLVGYSSGRDEALWKEFEQENWALDYRIKVDCDPTKIRQIPIQPKFPCFFGDMGEQQSSSSRQFVEIKGDFTITFTCLHSELTETINNQFPDFLRTKNFGLRQSKGFGSFTVQSEKGPFIPLKEHNAYYFRVNATRSDDLFKHIELFWRVLRAGYNRPDKYGDTVIYVKCPLFFYLRDQWHLDIVESNVSEEFKTRMAGKPVQWDKRSIKQTYFSTALRQQEQNSNHQNPDILNGYPTQSDNNRYFLLRDLLGLASESQWKWYNATIKKKHSPKSNQETIDRFKSPVLFKPVRNGDGYDVYVCVKPIPTEFGNQAFLIQRGNEAQARLTLETPPPGAFRITKYFDYVKREIADLIENADPQVVTVNDDRDPDWRKIKAVFNSFRKL